MRGRTRKSGGGGAGKGAHGSEAEGLGGSSLSDDGVSFGQSMVDEKKGAFGGSIPDVVYCRYLPPRISYRQTSPSIT